MAHRCYQAKKRKMCFLLSTRLEFGAVNSEDSKLKCNTILRSNQTKLAVDTLDQMTRSSSVKSGVRRWPLAMFFNVVDFAAITVFILFRKVTGRKLSRRQFLKEMVDELVSAVTPAALTLHPFGDILESSSKNRCGCHQCHNKIPDTCSYCEKTCYGKCVFQKRL